MLMAEHIEFLDNFDPTPRLTKLGHGIVRLFHFLPEQPLAPHGDHPPRGAAAMLDLALEAQDGGE